MHHCCDALTVGAREFYPEFAKQTDLVQKMANFLGETDSINPLMVSYYSKVVINFLSQEPENVREIMEVIKMKFSDLRSSRNDGRRMGVGWVTNCGLLCCLNLPASHPVI